MYQKVSPVPPPLGYTVLGQKTRTLAISGLGFRILGLGYVVLGQQTCTPAISGKGFDVLGLGFDVLGWGSMFWDRGSMFLGGGLGVNAPMHLFPEF